MFAVASDDSISSPDSYAHPSTTAMFAESKIGKWHHFFARMLLLPPPPSPHSPFFPVRFYLFSINCLVVCFFPHPATTRGRWVGRDGLGIMRMTCNSRWRLRSSVRQWPKVTNEAGMRWSLTGQDEAFKDERYFLYAY